MDPCLGWRVAASGCPGARNLSRSTKGRSLGSPRFLFRKKTSFSSFSPTTSSRWIPGQATCYDDGGLGGRGSTRQRQPHPGHRPTLRWKRCVTAHKTLSPHTNTHTRARAHAHAHAHAHTHTHTHARTQLVAVGGTAGSGGSSSVMVVNLWFDLARARLLEGPTATIYGNKLVNSKTDAGAVTDLR